MGVVTVNSMTAPIQKRITQKELEDYLWGAAQVLRGLIDAGDYKQIIFPLLFLKRLSDVYDEEHARALEDYDGDEEMASLPENHRFDIPEGAHWEDVRATNKDLGTTIRNAMRKIEAANLPKLTGVFGSGDWGNKEMFSDAILKDLIEHFSTRSLSMAAVPEDELGNGYEYLIRKFADDSGHTAQEFYTNRTLVHAMTQMLDIRPGESVYDPTCGTGGMLISAAAEVGRQGEDPRTLRLYGQELNYGTSAIAKMNLFLHGVNEFKVAHGDTLATPRFLADEDDDYEGLKRFDTVLANPPYSISNWSRSTFATDPFGRQKWGVPPQGRADYAFIQHIAASMHHETGRAAIVLPHGVLFRQEESAIRRGMVESDVLEAVIGVGPGLFYNSPMEAVVLVLRSRKSPRQQRKTLFIDAVNDYIKVGKQSFLSETNQKRIFEAYRSATDEPGYSALVDNETILGREDASLKVSLNVPRVRFEAVLDLTTSAAASREAAIKSMAKMRNVEQMLEEGL